MPRITSARLNRVDPIPARSTILEWLELSDHELTQVVRENPSLRGMIVGYVAEFQLRKLFVGDPRISNLTKDDDHDRTSKGDLRFDYKGHTFRIESKSLQTNLTRKNLDGTFNCTFQCDASDARDVSFSDGSTVTTTSLKVGEFDALAVCMFAVANGWSFAFAKNSELPRSNKKSYTELQRSELLSTNMKIGWPVTPPYQSDPFSVLDALVLERSREGSSR
jgi:hypothetical protein